MDLRHICHLVAETLKLSGGNLLGEDAGAVHAQVAAVGEDAGTVHLTVESRDYEIIVFEKKRRGEGPMVRPDAEVDCP
jgi:hypothetical protein